MANEFPFEAMAKALKKELKNLPRRMGVVIVRETKLNFKRQGFFSEKWPKRQKAHRGDRRRNLLIETGVLRRSIRSEARGNNIIIKSDVPYASIHNQGGTIKQKPTERQRRLFYAKYKETGDRKYMRMYLAETLTIKIPKRQFMGNSPQLTKAVNEFVERRIQKALKTD